MGELIDRSDIAALFSVSAHTVQQWRYRGILPEPVRRFGHVMAWDRSEVVAWGKKTGRLF